MARRSARGASVAVLVSCVVTTLAAGCSDERSSGCPAGEVRYVGQGFTFLVPAGSTPSVGMTADVGPVHAEAGYSLTVDGTEVSLWRSSWGGPPEDLETLGDAVREVNGSWFAARSDDPTLAKCIFDSMSYDEAMDRSDD